MIGWSPADSLVLNQFEKQVDGVTEISALYEDIIRKRQ